MPSICTELGTMLRESSFTAPVRVLICFLCRFDNGYGVSCAKPVCTTDNNRTNRYILLYFNRLMGISNVKISNNIAILKLSRKMLLGTSTIFLVVYIIFYTQLQ